MWSDIYFPILKGVGEALFQEGGIFILLVIAAGFLLLSRRRRKKYRFVDANVLLGLHLHDATKHPGSHRRSTFSP